MIRAPRSSARRRPNLVQHELPVQVEDLMRKEGHCSVASTSRPSRAERMPWMWEAGRKGSTHDLLDQEGAPPRSEGDDDVPSPGWIRT